MNMSENIKICVLGGDGRQTAVAQRLGQRYECAVWGVERVPDTAVRCDDWRDAVRGADAVVLPLPVSRDGKTLNGSDGVKLNEIVSAMRPSSFLCGGMIPNSVREMAAERCAAVYDYFESESVQIRNAVPTAEGTVAALIGEMPVTVDGMTVLVTGYGRCARTIAQKLILLGADVYAAARSEKDLAWAWVDGCAAITLDEMRECPPSCDAVVNTVPVRLIDGSVLGKLDSKTVVFDLSGGGVGVDADAARECGIKVIPLPSLPGKTSPETAGNIIADAILRKLGEHFEIGGTSR